jgi:hypothetical protein
MENESLQQSRSVKRSIHSQGQCFGEVHQFDAIAERNEANEQSSYSNAPSEADFRNISQLIEQNESNSKQ